MIGARWLLYTVMHTWFDGFRYRLLVCVFTTERQALHIREQCNLEIEDM